MENLQFSETQGVHKNQLITEKLDHSWEKTLFNYFQLLKLNSSLPDTEYCKEKQGKFSPGTCCKFIEMILNIYF